MPETASSSRQSRFNGLRQIWHLLRDRLVQPVSNGNAACEFECQELECKTGEWETCENRLRIAAQRSIPARASKPTGAQ